MDLGLAESFQQFFPHGSDRHIPPGLQVAFRTSAISRSLEASLAFSVSTS